MKRTILFAAILISAVVVKAQAPLGFGSMNQPFFRHYGQVADSNTHQKKWFLSKYAGISAGYMFFNGGGGPYLSAPMGLQLNRQLNNNVYAFAGVSVAPAIFNFGSPFTQPGYKASPFMNNNRFGAYSSAYMGVMYVNDERTFSISGSIGVSNYYGHSPYYSPTAPTIKNYHQQ
ncbi:MULTISPECIES: hypothetical protein [Niastella]|uniref:Outer membrane protein beta-barrel domain-containing protein n=1 Tax=Niastella soli TaxID=2821487 RepID=A0ABS3Z2D9_9BACT|nr:hypothetical protein [Niastella soli]MBO9204336.1 hypothetical protein [Niastella soli]